MTAKLIHTPADRTRAEPKNKVLLQPTPKGVAVLQSYCKIFGLKSQNSVPILNSNFNSMDLFVFERSAITDAIVYSEYFIHLLFSKFIGPKPNIWTPANPPDEIPSPDHRAEIVDEFDFSNFQNESFQFSSFEQYQQQQQTESQQSQNPSKKLIPSLNLKKTRDRESPFHHNFFTNPESDSHIQYYVSNKGVRLYHNHEFGNSLKVEYCFNAKAAWQWLMDSTDIMYPQEAVLVSNLFYKYGLIEPIIVAPSTANSKKNFEPLKTSFYTLSRKGWEISSWSDKKRKIQRNDDEEIIQDASALTLDDSSENGSLSDDESPNSSNLNKKELDIKRVLADPGMRYLFRSHLEKEFCAENLDFYMDVKQFIKKVAMLKSLLASYNSNQEVKISVNRSLKPPSKRTLVKLVNECLSAIYNIYSSYITVGARYELNIDHLLRGKITKYMLHSSSPLEAQFSEKQSRSINADIQKENELPTPPELAHTRPEKILSQILSPVTSTDVEITSTPLQTRRIKNKNLSIDIINNDEANSPPKTPTEIEISRSLDLLYKLTPLIESVGQQILKMLEFDSFPKFLKSQTFIDANI